MTLAVPSRAANPTLSTERLAIYHTERGMTHADLINNADVERCCIHIIAKADVYEPQLEANQDAVRKLCEARQQAYRILDEIDRMKRGRQGIHSRDSRKRKNAIAQLKEKLSNAYADVLNAKDLLESNIENGPIPDPLIAMERVKRDMRQQMERAILDYEAKTGRKSGLIIAHQGRPFPGIWVITAHGDAEVRMRNGQISDEDVKKAKSVARKIRTSSIR
ncbi:MAG: hypothetical protein KBA51_06215 [Kiritimatiellae bacterium]|nr:hypothetical protein [Kiritimatiellia bacterium]